MLTQQSQIHEEVRQTSGGHGNAQSCPNSGACVDSVDVCGACVDSVDVCG